MNSIELAIVRYVLYTYRPVTVSLPPFLYSMKFVINNLVDFLLISDINECGLIDNVCDPDTSSCLNLAGSYTCICQAGYTKDDIDMVCVPFRTYHFYC